MGEAEERAARIEAGYREAMDRWAEVGPAAVAVQQAFFDDRWAQVVEGGPALLPLLASAGRMGQAYAAMTRDVVGRAYANLEDLVAARRWLIDALADPDDLDEPDLTRGALAFVQVRLGDLGGLDVTLGALERSRTPSFLAMALRLRAVLVWWSTGDMGAAGGLLEESVLADPPPEPGVWWHDGVYRVQFLAEAGRTREALPLAMVALEQKRRETTGFWGSRIDLALMATIAARILTAEGRPSEGSALAEEAVGIVGERDYPRSCALLARAAARTGLGDLDGALADVEGAMAISARQRTLPVAVDCLRVRMDLAGERGEDPEPFRRQGAQAAAALGHVPAARWFDPRA